MSRVDARPRLEMLVGHSGNFPNPGLRCNPMGKASTWTLLLQPKAAVSFLCWEPEAFGCLSSYQPAEASGVLRFSNRPSRL